MKVGHWKSHSRNVRMQKGGKVWAAIVMIHMPEAWRPPSLFKQLVTLVQADRMEAIQDCPCFDSCTKHRLLEHLQPVNTLHLTKQIKSKER